MTDDMDEDEEFRPMPAADERRFTGELSRDDIAIPVAFTASARGDGEIVITFEPFPIDKQSRALERAWSDDRGIGGLHTLRGVAEDGARFETTELVVSSFKQRLENGGPHTFRPDVKYQRAAFFVPAETAERPMRRLWVKGFECFPEVSASCPLGDVVMWGVARLDEPDVVSGAIEIRGGKEIADMEAWKTQSEALLWHIRSIMSFGASVTLRAPLSELRIGGDVEIACRSQVRQARSAMYSFHKLDLQPGFDAAVRTFFAPHGAKGVGLAIEWMAQDSTYNEIRLISAMTALEHLLDVNLDEPEVLIMPEDDFPALRKAIAKALPDIAGAALDETQIGEMKGKLGELNRRALRRKIELLVAKWNVPMQGIEESRLAAALGARNKIVHTGRHERREDTDPSLWEHVTVVRELVVRMILTTLGFEGQYVTYMDGARRVQFPPAS